MDIEFDNEPGREFVVADGFVRKGELKMSPGQISWSPRFESINGTIIVDGTQSPPLGAVKSLSLIHILDTNSRSCRYWGGSALEWRCRPLLPGSIL